MVWKYYVFQGNILGYNVGINTIFYIISFWVLSATIRAPFSKLFNKTILKAPAIYLYTCGSI